MRPEIERQLMRLLHGELPTEEAVEWRRRLAADPELARSFDRLRDLWSDLELPAVAPAGSDFNAVFWRRVQAERPESVTEMWRQAPSWGRALAAVALVAGIGVGAVVGGTGAATSDESLLAEAEPTLAESYWVVIADADVEGEDAP